MSDPLTDAVAWLADRLEMPTGDVRALLEEAEDNGVLTVRVVTEDAEPGSEMDAIRAAGRGACLCPLSTIERVVVDHGTCGRGGCPYGGDV